MTRISAVICEYNPFHSGHRRQLELMKGSRREGGGERPEFIIALMSGNFVQRGEPAVFDKFSRASMALNAGADLVLEIPSVFSSSSAREFAHAGVALAEAAGIIDTLCFGVEDKVTLRELMRGLDLYCNAFAEGSDFHEGVKTALKEGKTYPEAVAATLIAEGADPGFVRSMSKPNNLLALCYMDALKGADITPFPIAREEGFLSSSQVRSLIRENRFEDALRAAPECVRDIYVDELKAANAVFPDDMSDLLNLRLLDAKYIPGRDLQSFLDVSPDMANRLIKSADRLMSFEERAEYLKTRQYTLTRVRRALLHIVLGLSDTEFAERKSAGYISYIRILGLRKSAAENGLLKRLKDNAKVPLVAKPADAQELISRDIYRDQIYYSLKRTAGEYLRSPVIV